MAVEQRKPFGEWKRAMDRQQAIREAGKAGQQMLTADAGKPAAARLWEGDVKSKDSCEARVNKILATIKRR